MSSMFNNVSTSMSKLHVQVARKIARGILSGDLVQGSKIPNEQTLCEQFSVSRTALREALKLLISKGLLLSKSKVGTTVMDKENWNFFDPQLLEWMDGLKNSDTFNQQFLGLRKAIEPEACALAAKNASAKQRIALSGTFQKMEIIAKKFDQERWIEVDMYFHRLIFLSTGNDFYLPFGNVLATIFKSFIHHSSKDGGLALKSIVQFMLLLCLVMPIKHVKHRVFYWLQKNTVYPHNYKLYKETLSITNIEGLIRTLQCKWLSNSRIFSSA